MAKRPNILLIITEQQRGDCLGIEGHPVLLTPTMDGIAQRGARFPHFYSACPTCISARRSILAGQLPQTHGLVGYKDGVEWEPEATLAQMLRDDGYQTCWIGRSMHQHPARKRFGYDEVETTTPTGYDDYGEWLKETAPFGHGGWFGGGVMHNDWTARPWPLEEHLHQTNWTVARALRFLRRRDPTCPFFLTVSFIASHPPLQPPAFYLDRYLRTGVPERVIGDWAEPPGPEALRNQDMVAPSYVDLTDEALLSCRAAYYGLINHMDDQLRRLLNPIVGLTRKDTIVALTSDHGEMLGDHYCWRKSHAYEPSARVPFLVEGPAELGLKQGTLCNEPATHADIMPTLLDLVGIGVPASVDGLSLAPVLRGEHPEWRPYVHIEHAPLQHALTDGCEKYIWFPREGREQFFDLRVDPKECHDLSLDPEHSGGVGLWRERLVAELTERPEGFVADGVLVAGRPYGALLPHGGTPSDFKRERFV